MVVSDAVCVSLDIKLFGRMQSAYNGISEPSNQNFPTPPLLNLYLVVFLYSLADHYVRFMPYQMVELFSSRAL